MDSFNTKSLTTTFGSNVLGTFVSSVLYGFTCFLAARYYRHYLDDRPWFKYMVGSLWLLDTIHLVLSMHYSYYYLVTRFGDRRALTSAVWSFQTTIILTVFPPFISNMFYLSRLYKIGQRNVLLIGGIALLVLGRLGLEFADAVLLYMHPSFADHSRYGFLVKAYCSISSVADILLAVLITWNLYKRRTGFKKSDQTIDLIVVYIVSTGILTSIVCFLSFLCTVLIRHGLVDVALHAILGKLYVISVLAVLNSRQPHVRQETSLYEVSAFGVDSENSPEKCMNTGTRYSTGAFIKSGSGTLSMLVNPESQRRNTVEIQESKVNNSESHPRMMSV